MLEELQIDGAWDEEIRARVEAIDEGCAVGIPYQQIKKEMAERSGLWP